MSFIVGCVYVVTMIINTTFLIEVHNGVPY
jgi:hypothetical protein